MAAKILGQRQTRFFGRMRKLGDEEAQQPLKKQKPDPTVARANKRLASRFYQRKSGHCLTGQYL